MVFGRSFLVTDLSIHELEQRGLAGKTVDALRGLRERHFSSREEFLHVLEERTAAPMSKGEQKLILKHSRQSLLGLERLIPHRSTREWVEALIFAVVVAVIVRTFLFAPFKIPSGSMVPTIEIGDHIFATMYSYGIPVPFTDTKLFPQQIERGDIVIFPYPLDPSVDYIKRVVALQGETVKVVGKQVFIDGEPLDEPYAHFDRVILNYHQRNGGYQEQHGPFKVPPGKLFVMGDNRFNSADSRVWEDERGKPRPFVDISSVKGKGRIIYWSHDPEAGWLGGYRFGRIGSFLE
jgi:signal peptidase I